MFDLRRCAWQSDRLGLKRLDLFGFFISVAMLVRIIVAVSVHPRVSLLVATVTKGIDDFMHFFLLLGILYMCFALIALLRFAPTYDSFATFEITLVTEFQLMIGNLPVYWADDILLSIFILFFLIAVFFLMVSARAAAREKRAQGHECSAFGSVPRLGLTLCAVSAAQLPACHHRRQVTLWP